jgi:hypothetical protein
LVKQYNRFGRNSFNRRLIVLVSAEIGKQRPQDRRAAKRRKPAENRVLG